MLVSLAFLSATAHSASCDKHIAAVKSSDSESVAGAFAALAACDQRTAEASFNDALAKATNADALTALALVAIDKEVWKPMWSALCRISSYEARDEVAHAVGMACADENTKVVRFLQGAYLGLRDIEFQQWDDAFVSCVDSGLTVWMDKEVRTPPNKRFDEKFVNLMAIYVKRNREAGLPALTASAIKSAESGPFDAILFKIGESVAAEMGGSTSPENQALLEAALVEVASKVSKEKATAVASQLANSGSEAAAARLLPVLYGDVGKGGVYTYGAASIEQGDCGGKKQALVHYATVVEPGKRWTIIKDIEEPLRAEKAKLTKGCTIESPWPIVHSPTPIEKSAVEAWVRELETNLEGKGYEVKLAKGKTITLD